MRLSALARKLGYVAFWLGMVVLAYGIAGVFGVLVAGLVFRSTLMR